MKHQWLAYVIVAFLSIGAGVAIAGLPNNVPVDATIIPPTTTEAPAPTLPETTVPTTTEPDTTEPDTTEPETTEPDTTEPDTTDSVPADLPDRSEIIVGASNGAGIAGTAARAVVRLTELGYVDVTPLDGTDIVDFTTIYYADGFEAAAARMAEDLDIAPDLIAPLDDAPDVPDLQSDTQLLEYVGTDRAN
jgi:hypothetical protein